MPKAKKNPWISAVLNFFVWGLGYLYNGDRNFLAFGVLISRILSILSFLIVSFSPMTVPPENIGAANLAGGVLLLSVLVLSVAFAYDSYGKAQKINGKK